MTTIIAGFRSSARSAAQSPYIARMIHEEEGPGKDAIRARVAEFILRHHSPLPCRMFSLPGANWLFERHFQHIGPRDSQFIAVERLSPVLDAGLTFMPGCRRYRINERGPYGNLHAIQSECASIFHADMSAFLSFFPSHGHKQDKSRFRRVYWNWTCAWLDFTSQVCREVAYCLPRIQPHCDLDARVVPVAVTVLKARESICTKNAIELSGGHRADYITKLFDSSNHGRFEERERIEYQSSEGTPMLVVLGLIHMRESRAVAA